MFHWYMWENSISGKLIIGIFPLFPSVENLSYTSKYSLKGLQMNNFTKIAPLMDTYANNFLKHGVLQL